MTGEDAAGLVWKDPPYPESRVARAAQIQAIANELRAHPGQWALISTHGTKQAANAAAKVRRTGVIASFRPAGSFEAVHRGCDVYARFVGDIEVDG